MAFFHVVFSYFFSIRWKDGAVRKYTQPTASQYPRKIKLAQLSLCHACAAFFFLVVPHTQMRAKHSGEKKYRCPFLENLRSSCAVVSITHHFYVNSKGEFNRGIHTQKNCPK